MSSEALRALSPLRLTAVAASVYLLLVALMWCPFNPESGMPYETAFPYYSETSSVLEGFLYREDPLRIHTNTFYHIAYLLGGALGITGSFVPYQITYAILWWARGMLVFLILRRFLPHSPVFAYLGGALVLVHSSDGTLQWVGQLNQFGFIFWMLLAFYLFLCAFQAVSLRVAAVCLLLAVSFEYMSLWSYESQLFIVLLLPLTLLISPSASGLRFFLVSIPWYSVVAIYIYLSVSRYLHSEGRGYQEAVLRADWSPVTIAGDWLFNMAASLAFWSWPRFASGSSITAVAGTLGALAALAVVSGGLFFYMGRWQHQEVKALPSSVLRAVFVIGLVLLIASFPAYVLLASARSLWRTQMDGVPDSVRS